MIGVDDEYGQNYTIPRHYRLENDPVVWASVAVLGAVALGFLGRHETKAPDTPQQIAQVQLETQYFPISRPLPIISSFQETPVAE